MMAQEQGAQQWTRSLHDADDDVRGLPELGVEMRALRYELRAYVDRHDREHRRLHVAIRENTQYRTDQQAQARILRWLVGSNLAALLMLGLAVLALVTPH